MTVCWVRNLLGSKAIYLKLYFHSGKFCRFVFGQRDAFASLVLVFWTFETVPNVIIGFWLGIRMRKWDYVTEDPYMSKQIFDYWFPIVMQAFPDHCACGHYMLSDHVCSVSQSKQSSKQQNVTGDTDSTPPPPPACMANPSWRSSLQYLALNRHHTIIKDTHTHPSQLETLLWGPFL